MIESGVVLSVEVNCGEEQMQAVSVSKRKLHAKGVKHVETV